MKHAYTFDDATNTMLTTRSKPYIDTDVPTLSTNIPEHKQHVDLNHIDLHQESTYNIHMLAPSHQYHKWTHSSPRPLQFKYHMNKLR